MDITVNSKRYKIQGTLGIGGYSSVYRVSDHLNRVFALKKISLQNINEHELISGFQKEIALIKRLQDEPRVIKYIDSEEAPESIYLVLELGDVDLDTIIHNSPRLELYGVCHYSREIFKCVKAIHGYGIIHSDLKPANFISVRGSLKLIDFGISDIPMENTMNVYRPHAIGTLSYMAPETFCEHTLSIKPDKHSVGPSSDVWGCGCIVYEMIYRKRVFEKYRDKFQAIMDPQVSIEYPNEGHCFTVPWSFKSLIRQCLTRDLSQRITIEDALKSLALTETYVSVADLRNMISRAFQLGIDKKGALQQEIQPFVDKELAMLR